jgi:iron complex outermembrane receptor protein
VTPRFKLSEDLMLYVRLASGYRAGGPNQVVVGVPPQYQPDKTRNYEVGAKGNFLDHLISFDASVYYIDWRDIQLSLIDSQSNQGYTGNAGGAKSEGVELSLESRPVSALTLAAWVVWNEAILTQPFPPASTAAGGIYGGAGDRLPYSSPFSGNFSVNEEFPLIGTATGFLGAAVGYVGGRLDNFISTPDRQPLPAYAKADLRAGVTYGTWKTNLFVTNVTDRRGLLGGGAGNFIPYAFQYIQPRTVGLSVAKTF